MSETPVPELRMDAVDDAPPEHPMDDSEESTRPRFKTHAGGTFSGIGIAPHEEPDEEPESAPLPSEHSHSHEDSDFVAGLQAAGLLRELSLSELERIELLLVSAGPARRLDLLEAYYSAHGDAVAALRRRATDRWFLFQASDTIGAPQLVQRLLGVVPELSGAHLERVGSSAGTLVLRLGEHLCAIDDEAPERGVATVSVHEVVRAMNVLLERKGVRARLVGILGDGQREAYVGLPSLMNALTLVEADYLTAADAESLMALTAW